MGKRILRKPLHASKRNRQTDLSLRWIYRVVDRVGRAGGVPGEISGFVPTDLAGVCGGRLAMKPGIHKLNRARELTRIVVVGCGGTGATLLGGLPYLHQAFIAAGGPRLSVIVADGDR